MSNLLVGPSALTPWIETSVCDGIRGVVNPFQNEPKLAQVIQYVPAAYVGKSGMDTGGLPFLRLHDGKTSIFAVLVGLEAQRSARDNTHSDSQPEESNNTPEKGCIVCLHNWSVSTIKFKVQSRSVENQAKPPPVCLCLAIQGRVDNLGGHGIGVIQNTTDIHQKTQYLQAMVSIRHDAAKLHSNLLRNQKITPIAVDVGEDGEDSDDNKIDDQREGKEEHAFPVGDVEMLFHDGEQGLKLLEDLVHLANQKQVEYQKDQPKQQMQRQPKQQPHTTTESNQTRKQPEEVERFDIEPPSTPPHAFEVYAENGNVSLHVTDPDQLQELFINVIETFESQERLRLSTQNEHNNATIRDSGNVLTAKVPASMPVASAPSREVTLERQPIHKPYKNSFSRRNGNDTTDEAGTRPGDGDRVKQIEATLAQHFTQSEGITNMLCSDDEDGDNRSDGENNTEDDIKQDETEKPGPIIVLAAAKRPRQEEEHNDISGEPRKRPRHMGRFLSRLSSILDRGPAKQQNMIKVILENENGPPSMPGDRLRAMLGLKRYYN